MDKITTDLTITNRLDEGTAELGFIPEENIRSVTLKNVLVDTGATTLCLPADIIATLGLKVLREVNIATAIGVRTTRIFQDAKISLLGREGTFECLELPGGQNALLGVIPMESLGVELDLQKQSLKLLPMNPESTYITIL